MPTNVSGDFTTSRRMSDMDGVLEIERGYEFGQVVRVGIQIIPIPWLALSAMAPPAVGDAPKPA